MSDGVDSPAGAPADTPAEDIDSSRAPLIEHLMELRHRLLWSFVAILIAFLGCYWAADKIYAFLVRPLANALGDQAGRKMIYTGLHEAFFTEVKVAFFAALAIAFPVIANQLWKFVAPGLYKNERRAFLPFLVATPILFIGGAALAYYVVMPLAWRFFLGFEQSGMGGGLPVVLEARVGEYLSLVMQLMFAFGLAFELPVLLLLLARAGFITSDTLKSKRKYAIVITFTIAAVLTPPDVISQIGLGIPILLLYELSILAIRLAERKREQATGES